MIGWSVPAQIIIYYQVAIMKIQILQQATKEIFNNELKLTPKILNRRQQFLLKIPLFELIHQKKGDQNFQIILNHIAICKYDFGSIIFMNEDQRTFNYILRGSVMIFSKNKQSQSEPPKFYKRMEAHEHFGEKIQYGKQFVDSARAVNICYVLQLQKNIFYRVFSGHFKYDELKDKINFLQRVWLFKEVKKALLQRILLTNDTKNISRNSILARPGERAEYLFVIMEGELSLHKKRESGYQSAFCTFIKSQVCGVDELLKDYAYEYSIVCSSDYAQVLKVDRQVILQIIDRDIRPEVLASRKQVEEELKEKNLDFKSLLKISETMNNQRQQAMQVQQLRLKRRRYKSEGDVNNEPLDKMKILNELFKKQIQLKEQKLRGYKLQFIRQHNKTLYCTNRLSTFVNNSSTYDKSYIENYQRRRERRIVSLIKQQTDFQGKQFNLVPSLNVKRSNAVKNQKRKLNQSRRTFYQTLIHL